MTAEPVGPLVSTAWLEEHLHEPGLRIFDTSARIGFDPDSATPHAASGRDDWARAHIPGSGFVDLLELAGPARPSGHMLPSAERFAEEMSAVGVAPGSHVVVYDSGAAMFATRLWWVLRVFGFDTVSVLDGGWRAWVREGRLASSEPCRYPPARFEAAFHPERLATLEQLESYVDRGAACLVNALSPEAFRGEATLGYRRPGRIPGSRNVPHYELLDPESGRFRPVAELRDRLSASGALAQDRPIVSYCGGGMAATTVAFALELVGRRDVAVYDGSLNEWTADPDRPVAIGPQAAT
jgi:thiosulfate/3-mercaptopyruvate sulfurtransferase